jgi:hypothetical protein
MKQTAVEWFSKNLKNFPHIKHSQSFKDLVIKAKEMEQEQRQEDTNHGYSQGWDDGNQNKEPMRPDLKQQEQ